MLQLERGGTNASLRGLYRSGKTPRFALAMPKPILSFSVLVTSRGPKNGVLGNHRHLSGDRDEFNGSAQHWLEVYWQESQNLKSFADVDLSAVLSCPVRLSIAGQVVGSLRKVLS